MIYLTHRLQERKLSREDHPPPQLLLLLLQHPLLSDLPAPKDNCSDLELVRRAPANVSTCLVRGRPVDQVEGEVDG